MVGEDEPLKTFMQSVQMVAGYFVMLGEPKRATDKRRHDHSSRREDASRLKTVNSDLLHLMQPS